MTDEIRAQLRFVRVPERDINLSRFPNFFILGPQRTGTTWIYQNLRDHPEILWPRSKEIFFFNLLCAPEHPLYRSNDLEWYLSQFQDTLRWRAAKTALSLWSTRRWYRPIVTGEATASYAAMAPEYIREALVLNPRLRAILMIRNPIDRVWSHAKKDVVRKNGRQISEIPDAEFEAFFTNDYQLRCAQYVENYEKWRAMLPEGHLFVGKFDDIISRPAALLKEVCDFLGVSSERRFLGRSVDEAVNPTVPKPVPAKHKHFLERLLKRDLDNLEKTFGLRWD